LCIHIATSNTHHELAIGNFDGDVFVTESVSSNVGSDHGDLKICSVKVFCPLFINLTPLLSNINKFFKVTKVFVELGVLVLKNDKILLESFEGLDHLTNLLSILAAYLKHVEHVSGLCAGCELSDVVSSVALFLDRCWKFCVKLSKAGVLTNLKFQATFIDL